MWPHLVIPFAFLLGITESWQILSLHFVTGLKVVSSLELFEQGTGDLTTQPSLPLYCLCWKLVRKGLSYPITNPWKSTLILRGRDKNSDLQKEPCQSEQSLNHWKQYTRTTQNFPDYDSFNSLHARTSKVQFNFLPVWSNVDGLVGRLTSLSNPLMMSWTLLSCLSELKLSLDVVSFSPCSSSLFLMYEVALPYIWMLTNNFRAHKLSK